MDSVRVYLERETDYVREYPSADYAIHLVSGHLSVFNSNKQHVADFPSGRWAGVERFTSEAAIRR